MARRSGHRGRQDHHGQPDRRIVLPSDVVDIFRKDTYVTPKRIEKDPPKWKVKCRLCAEPRMPFALDEYGICRSVATCNKNRRLNRELFDG